MKAAWQKAQSAKCSKRYALNVARNAMFLLSLTQVDRYIAENVGLREDRRDEDHSDDTKHDIIMVWSSEKIPDFLNFYSFLLFIFGGIFFQFLRHIVA